MYVLYEPAPPSLWLPLMEKLLIAHIDAGADCALATVMLPTGTIAAAQLISDPVSTVKVIRAAERLLLFTFTPCTKSR
jgi:hypothetical protein